ncbi:two-component system sensor histidine kinase [Pedobacter sp. BAL39]|nr:two-component system sensor histidine kinase [Pedobacter sp. BAL39]
MSAIGLILLNASIFYFVSQFNFEDFFDRLDARVNLAAQTNIYPDKNSSAYEEVRARYLEKLEEEKDYIIKINPENNKFKKPLPLPQSFYKAILDNGRARYNEENHFYVGATFSTSFGKYIVIVAASDPYGFQELQELKRVLIISFVISLILTYIAGAVLSHYTIQPVRNITRRVKSIKANNLHSRLDELKGRDEMSELVSTFNNMLTRLETAFETQNNFISNASHELRTPLTIITSETELLLSGQQLDASTTHSVKTILSEAEKLQHILTSLLGLAQSGFDGKKQNWQQIRVDELVLNVADSVKKIDPNRVIDIDFSELPDDEAYLYTEGNVNLLQLAISNIVMNGCKYSNNQPVKIQARFRDNLIMVIVTDRGIGIPEKDQQHIFEPFFRASNTGKFEGYGIGLPLTLNIIRLHKGSIGIRSEVEKGTEIQIILPALNRIATSS